MFVAIDEEPETPPHQQPLIRPSLALVRIYMR